jgi:hypothetical protein
MRHLLQPQVLNRAAPAALVSALACYPRMSLWLHRPGSVGYVETMIFACGVVLWGFVFAWHAPYTNRPVFIFKPELGPLAAVTVAGIGAAAVFQLWLDPSLRAIFPEEYPADLRHWLATLLFTLVLSQLFLTFAAFDWFIRLFKNRWLAMTLTALFAMAVQALKIHSLPAPVSPLLEAGLLVARFIGGLLAVEFYLRGGVLLVWWWSFLLEARLLFHLAGSF